MRYEVLQTGSDGNATLVEGKILIDCGVAFKKIEPYERNLRLVLLTHAHHDHFRPSTVQRLAKDRPTLRFGCCEWMVPFLITAGVELKNIDVYDTDGQYCYGDPLNARVQAERLFHNASNCGYHLNIGREWLFYATDTGHLDGISAKGYDVYLVEANHREAEIEARAAEKLEAGQFSYETAAAQNHLSYEKAIDWLHKNMGPDSIWVPMHGHKDRDGGGSDDGRKTNAVKENHGE